MPKANIVNCLTLKEGLVTKVERKVGSGIGEREHDCTFFEELKVLVILNGHSQVSRTCTKSP